MGWTSGFHAREDLPRARWDTQSLIQIFDKATLVVVGSNSSLGTQMEFFLYRFYSPPTTLGAVTRMLTVRAQMRSYGNRVKKSLGIIYRYIISSPEPKAHLVSL